MCSNFSHTSAKHSCSNYPTFNPYIQPATLHGSVTFAHSPGSSVQQGVKHLLLSLNVISLYSCLDCTGPFIRLQLSQSVKYTIYHRYAVTGNPQVTRKLKEFAKMCCTCNSSLVLVLQTLVTTSHITCGLKWVLHQ